jgi:hypothetical protein
VLVPDEPAVEAGDIGYRVDGPIRTVQMDRPGPNSRVQHALAVVIDVYSDPLCNNLENHAMEAGLIGLVALLVAA